LFFVYKIFLDRCAKAFETSQECPLYNKIPLKPVKSALYTTKLELGGGIMLFCCRKQVGGLDPFGPALKNCHTLLFKSGTM
jgi:hypothetical protein